MQRIISSDRGFTLVTVPDNGDRRIEISLEDSDGHVELRMPMSGSSTATLSMPPDLVKSVHEWLGCWLAAQALRLATDSEPGKGTGVWVPLDKWTELHTQLAAVTAERDALAAKVLTLQVDAGALVRLRDDTDNVLWSLKPQDIDGAINWGDLGTRETQEVIDESRRWHRVIIEEADPSNPALHAAVLAGLVALGWQADDVEIETAW